MQYNNSFNDKLKKGEIKKIVIGDPEPQKEEKQLIIENPVNNSLSTPEPEPQKKEKKIGKPYSFFMPVELLQRFKILSLSEVKSQTDILELALSEFINKYDMKKQEQVAIENMKLTKKKPEKKGEQKGKQFSMVMDIGLFQKFKLLAISLNMTQSDLINLALEEHLNKYDLKEIQMKAIDNTNKNLQIH